MNLSELVKNAESVFVIPDSITRLKECIDDPSSTVDDVAEIITYDPTLTSQLLKIANSALYRFPNTIETVTKAIQVIGTQATFDLSLSYGVSHTFRDIDTTLIDMERYWEQCVSCALLCKFFAEEKRIRGAEKLFVSGLLHNIGELAMVQLHPELAKRCAEHSAASNAQTLQRQILGFTYSDFSAALIQDWGLPESIYHPISHIHDNNLATMDINAKIVKLAYGVSLDNINADIYPDACSVSDALLESIKLDVNDVEDALEHTNIQVLSVIQLFNPNGFNIF